MGVSEEAGKVATSTVEALKSNPSCLAAIILAAIFALLTFFHLQQSEQRNHEARIAIMERCFPLPNKPPDNRKGSRGDVDHYDESSNNADRVEAAHDTADATPAPPLE